MDTSTPRVIQDPLIEPNTPAFEPAPLPSTAHLDKSLVLMDGMFRATFKTAASQRPQVQLDRTFSNALAVYRGPQLGVDDLRILQAVLALAVEDHAEKREQRTTSSPSVAPPFHVASSYRRLSLVAGYKGAGTGLVNAVIAESLRRLDASDLHWQSASTSKPLDGPLLRLRKADFEEKGARARNVRLELHPRLGLTVRAGAAKAHYLQVDMDEVRALDTDAARLLHHRLCHLNRGEEAEHGLDRFVSYVSGGDSTSLTRHQWRHAENKVYAAIGELLALGWSFHAAGENSKGITKFLVFRPKETRRKR